MKLQKVETSDGNQEKVIPLIKEFWRVHNQIEVMEQDCLNDFQEWIQEGHRFYFLLLEKEVIGFAHLGSRGGDLNWLEHFFILPAFQHQGYGHQALKLIEGEVRSYSDSFYMEVAARNRRALTFYRNAGYDCLNTVTIRKDFKVDEMEPIATERIQQLEFEVRRPRKKED